MGQVYVYQAALLCEGCGEAERESLDAGGDGPEDPDDESTYDSDDYPKGPTEEGESDTPSHCDHCHVFLSNDGNDNPRRCFVAVHPEHGIVAVVDEEYRGSGKAHRSGHELRCEVVHCMHVDKIQKGHGP